MGRNEDDWQQVAAQHRQEQFTNKMRGISKRGRRGNRLFGGLLVLIGFGVLLFTVWAAATSPDDTFSLGTLKRVAWLGGGSIVTMSTGLAIWGGRLTRRD